MLESALLLDLPDSYVDLTSNLMEVSVAMLAFMASEDLWFLVKRVKSVVLVKQALRHGQQGDLITALAEAIDQNGAWKEKYDMLSGLPNANAKSQRFSYAISQIAPLSPVVALNRSFKSQIAARYAAFWHAVPQIVLTSFL